MYYVYILRCEDNTLYTGITTDVARRFAEHSEGKIKGAKYTRGRKPRQIEAVWQTDNKIDAAKVEYRIKKLRKAQKESLVAGDAKIGDLIEETAQMGIKRLKEF